MTAPEGYRRRRVRDGWVVARRDDDTGDWRLSWEPDEGHPDFSGRTYTPGDRYLPPGFPASNDPDDLLDWGAARWGSE